MNETIKIHGFKNLTLLSKGPYFQLYEGVRIHTDQRHWLQILHDDLVDNERVVRAFEAMVNLTPNLQHPNILSPLTFEENDGRIILVYEAFPGKSVRSLLDAEVPFVERRATKVIIQTARALQYAEIRGIRHGWLSADFIFCSKFNDEVKVFGFGSHLIFDELYLKKHAAAVSFIKSISPENLAPAKTPVIIDSYAMGCIYYELLSGMPPFKKVDIDKSKKEKLSYLAAPNKLNPKLSETASNVAMSLIAPEVRQRIGYSTVLDRLDLRKDEPIEADDASFEFKPTVKQRLRGAMADANVFSGGLVGSKKRVAYSSIVAFVFFILVAGLFIVSHLSSRDERHLQQVYDEFIANTPSESSDSKSVAPSETVSLRDSLASSFERITDESVSLYGRESSDQDKTVSEVEATPVADVKFTTLHITLENDDLSVAAIVTVNGKNIGVLSRLQPVDLQELALSADYVVAITAEGFEPWEKRIRLTAKPVNDLSVKLTPRPKMRIVDFAKAPFADKIRINGDAAKNLPCRVEMTDGVHRITFIDTKSNFSWSTNVTIGKDAPATITIPAEQVGFGEASIVLQNPIQYGYVFVRIDDETERHATPLKAKLSAGWHRLRIFRQDYRLSPADTMIFIRPNEKTPVKCKVLN